MISAVHSLPVHNRAANRLATRVPPMAAVELTELNPSILCGRFCTAIGLSIQYTWLPHLYAFVRIILLSVAFSSDRYGKTRLPMKLQDLFKLQRSAQMKSSSPQTRKV